MKILENVHPKDVYTYPIIELSPTQTPGKIMAQPPIHTFFPIWIGFANSHPAFRVSASLKFGALPKFVCLKVKKWKTLDDQLYKFAHMDQSRYCHQCQPCSCPKHGNYN